MAGKFTGRKIPPVGGAGRAQAQKPNVSNTKREGSLLRDLDTLKANKILGLTFVAAAGSPYTVTETDELLLVDATDGTVEILLGSTGNNGAQRVLRVIKLDTSTNAVEISVVATASGIFANGLERSIVRLARRGASITLIRIGEGVEQPGWWVLSDHARDEWFDQQVSAASVTVDGSAVVWIADTTSNSVTLNLPPLTSCRGRRYVFKKIAAANTMTVDGNGAETIDGAATQAVTGNDHVIEIVAGASEWLLLHLGAP